MKFRDVQHPLQNIPMLIWDCGPARVYVWKVSNSSNKDIGRWRMDLYWGALKSVGTFDTREEAEEKARQILDEHIYKLIKAIWEEEVGELEGEEE